MTQITVLGTDGVPVSMEIEAENGIIVSDENGQSAYDVIPQSDGGPLMRPSNPRG